MSGTWTNHYTTLLGVIGLAIGSGAALSTTAAGLIADNFGGTTAFLGLTGAGLCEDSIRFYVLRMHEAGMIKSSPQKIIAEGTDWRS